MRKFRIAICDDEPIILSQLKVMIEEISSRDRLGFTINAYGSGQDLLEHIQETDVAFLDISMPGLDGLETGRLIMKRNRDCKVIMATSKTEYFKETFKINAFRFITKPFDKNELKEALHAIRNLDIGKEFVTLYVNRNLYEIPQKDIAYITAYDSYVEAMVYGKAFRKETSLREMAEYLDKRMFFRVHRQYIVNIKWIDDYTDGYAQINGKMIPVSRRRKKEFEKVYIEFDLKFR